MTRLFLLAIVIALSGCTSFAPRCPTDAGAMQSDFGVTVERASYTQLTDNYAVTNRHTARLVMGDVVKSRNYDLAFFRHKGRPPEWGDAKLGEPVVVNGNATNWFDLAATILDIPPLWPYRRSEPGLVVALRPWYGTGYNLSGGGAVFIRGGGGGDGFSGGPVVDAQGRVVAVMWGYVEAAPKGEYHYEIGDGIAIPAAIVWAEFHRLVVVP